MKKVAFPAAAVALTLLGFALRVRCLDRADLWGDEAVSWAVADGPFSGVVARTVAKEAKPPLYFLALQVWMRVFGDSEASMRSLSLTAWPPFALLMVLLGRSCCGRWSLLPLLLAAVSPLLIYYGVEARPYAFLVGAETLFLWRALRADEAPSPRSGILLAAAAFLILSLQFTGLFFIAPVLVALLVRHRRNRKELAGLLIPQVAAGMLFAGLLLAIPGMALRLTSLQNQWWASAPSWVQVLSAPVRMLAPVASWKTAIDPSRPLHFLLLPCAALLFLLACWGLATSRRRSLLLPAGAGVLGLVALYSLVRANLLFERYYIGVAPVLLLGIGAALDALSEKWPASWKVLVPAVVGAQLALLGLLPPFEGAAHYRGPVAAVLARERGPVVILTAHWDGPSTRYCARRELGRVSVPDRIDENALADPRPLYYLHSASWGDRSGEARRVLSGKAAALVPVYEEAGTTVTFVERRAPK
jgi:uncharacterized membrane protein